MTVHAYNPNQCPYQVSTFSTLRLPRYIPGKILNVKVTTANSNVKSRLQHDIAHLHPLTSVCTKYQLPMPYSQAQGHYCKVKGQIKVSP